MKNKSISLLILFITLISIFAVSASAEKAIYVYRNSFNIDTNYISALNEAGFSVDTVPYYDLDETNMSKYSVMIVNNELFPNPELIPVNNFPAVIANTYHVYDWGWSDDISLLISTYALQGVVSRNDTITKGIPTVFNLYTTGNVPLYYLGRYDKAVRVKTEISPENTNILDAAIGTAKQGDVLLRGNIAYQRGCFYGITESDFWTNWSKELFKRCAIYAAHGMDSDGDNYTEDVDCNDSDATVHPGAVEIPYNGKDDDCNPATRDNDLDLDGYNSTVTGGSDCNDNNAAINPGATEVCNGLDDDCDAQIDEGLTAPLNSKQAGICAGSNQTCTGVGGWLDNYTGVASYENPEVSCDDLDNDCDGAIDEPCLQRDAACVNINAPDTVIVGRKYNISVTMLNDGKDTWNATALYKLGSQSPQDNMNWGLNRVNISEGVNVSTGQQYIFKFNITSPTNPGLYHSDWKMVQNGVTWFGDLCQKEIRANLNCVDNDSDGFYGIVPIECPAPNGKDCNDNNININPNASEVCNGFDDDCDGNIDEEPAASQSCNDSVGCTVDTCSSGSCQNNPDDTICLPDTLCADYYCNAVLDCKVNYAPITTECRAINGVCDIAEKCTGSNANCPADAFNSSSTVCRTSAGVCDAPDFCTGSNAQCLIDAKLSSQCRAAADICDAAENCNGVNNDCPADSVKPNTFECRTATGVCDVAEYCDGVDKNCSEDKHKSQGTDCGVCAACDVSGTCLYDETQNNDCNATMCPDACNLIPDGNALTWDYADDVANECTGLFTCSNNACSYNHECSVTSCSAECDPTHECENECVGGIRYYEGGCLAGCTCSYSTEDCDSYDGWHDTGNTQWVSTGECTEKEQKEQQYKDYSCSPGGCTFGITNTQWIDTGATRNKLDATPCNDGSFCNEGEACQSGTCTGGGLKDCSANNLPEIAICTNDPDNNALTWDSAAGFTSTCNEGSDACTASTYTYTHTCNISTCGAECETSPDCANKCSADGGTRYYNSPGCNIGCSCNYQTENCNLQDNWYYTINFRWVDADQCKEKEQRKKEYKDYSCSPGGCIYNITDTDWEDTGNTRNKAYGTICNDGLFCSVTDICVSGVCTGTARDCSGLNDQCNLGVCDDNADICVKDPVPKEGLTCDDGLFCTVSDICTAGACGGNAKDCSDGVSCTDDSCNDDLNQCVHTPFDSYCHDDVFCDGEEYCDLTLGCQEGAPVSCLLYNLPEIATCTNTPDNNALTWDAAAGFTSTCDEGSDVCTTSSYTYSHTCSYDDCNAECDLTHSCADTDCDVLDMCYSGSYRDYDDVANTCNLDCTCTDNICTAYTVKITDNDGDNYDTECDNDCDDADIGIHPGATELMDDIDQNCINDAPSLLGNIPNQEWLEDASQTIDLSLYFDDVDGDSLSFVSTSPNNIGIEIVGSIATLTPEANWHGTRHVVFTASDGSLTMSSNMVELVVTPVNDDPTVAVIPDQTWLEDTVKTLDLDAYFDDVDGDVLSYTSTTPANIDVDISGNIVTFTPDTNWYGMSSIIFTGDDGSGGIATSNAVDLIVTTINDAPILDYIPDITIMEGDFIKIVPSAVDPDGDSVSFTFTWPLNPDGEWQSDFNDAGIYYVTISVLDGKGGMDSQQISVTVTEAGNHAPALDYIVPVTVTEGDLVKIVPSAFDLDYDPLSFSFTPPLNSQGEWKTGYTDSGDYITTVTVSDGLLTDEQDVLITVLESGNHAPVLEVDDTIYVYEGEKVVVTPKTYDPDQEAVTISYSAPLDSNGEWQTKKGDKGTYYAFVSASDGLAVTTVKIRIVVSEPPFSDIYISGIKIFNEKLKPGTNLEMSISFADSGNIDLKGVSVAVYISELGVYRRMGPFNLKRGDDITKNLVVYIPEDAKKGEYTLKIVISNDDVRREKHRLIQIV